MEHGICFAEIDVLIVFVNCCYLINCVSTMKIGNHREIIRFGFWFCKKVTKQVIVPYSAIQCGFGQNLLLLFWNSC